MDNEDLQKLSEVRQIASKNWLSAASVSLAKLDEVKAKVYNIGITDSKHLKPTPRGAVNQGANGDQKSTRWASAAPPLSGVSMQKNAWNTISTVPEQASNVRDECTKQLFRASRPESAKTSTKRPMSGKLKRRPQSATATAKQVKATEKEDLMVEDTVDDENGHSILGVHGAKFNPSERPENFSHHSTSIGYVVPSQLDNDIQTIMNTDSQSDSCQNEEPIIYIPGAENMDAPPVPRSSPDLLIENSDPEDYIINDDIKENDSLNNIINQRKQKPIHLVMPNPDESFDEEENDFNPAIYVDVQVKQSDNYKSIQKIVSNGNYDHTITQVQLEAGDAAIKDTQYNKNTFSSLSEELNKEVQTLKRDIGTSSQSSNMVMPNKNVSKPRPKSAVKFDEKNNVTLDITPRIKDENEDVINNKGQRLRPYSGRRDLRYVKSKTDSGYSKIAEAKLRRTNSDQKLNVTESAKSAIKNRPQSAKVSTLTVSYIDDKDTDNDTESKTKPKSFNKCTKEVETLVSQLEDPEKNVSNWSENNYNSALGESSESRPVTPAKFLSTSEKNYYEVAMNLGPRRNKSKIQSEYTQTTKEANEKEVKKTVKTLALLDDKEIKEMKFISVIGTQEHKNKDYVAPRPPSASRPRPISASRQQSAHNKKSQNNTTEGNVVKLSTYRNPSFNTENKVTTTKQQESSKKITNNHQESKHSGDQFQYHLGINGNEQKEIPTESEQIETLMKLESELKLQQDMLKKELDIETENKNIDTKWCEPETEEPCVENCIEERPESRMGFRPDELMRDKENINTLVNFDKNPPFYLQQRRVKSTSQSRKLEEPPSADKQVATVSKVIKTRPISAHLSTENSCKCSHNHSTTDNTAMSKKTHTTNMHREGSITNILAKDTNFKGYANLTANKLDAKRKSKNNVPSLDVVEITTRQDDYEFETDGLKECRELQDKLLDNGVPVTLSALQRALLPPTEYGWNGPSYKSNVTPNHPAYQTTTGALLSKPERWLTKEYKKVREAKERVQIATEILEQQAREEREIAAMKKQRGTKKGKSKKKSK